MSIRHHAEQLEDRRLLSISVISGVLTVNNQISTAGRTIVVDVDSSGSSPMYRVTDNGNVHEFAETAIDSLLVVGSKTAANTIDVDASFPDALHDNGLYGGGGADTILGSAGGQDVIFGGAGADSIQSHGPDDILNGNKGADTIIGFSDDTINGNGGQDSISLGSGDNDAFGDAGNDTILAGSGNDTLYGKQGSDLLEGGVGEDLLKGGQGADTLIGGSGSSSLMGGLGRDYLAAANAGVLRTSATVPAASGHDSVSGGMGIDTLVSLSATDTLAGGVGANEFDAPSGATLSDFNAAQGDFEFSQKVVSGNVNNVVMITLTINVPAGAVLIPVGAGSATSGTSIAQVTAVNGNVATVLFQSGSGNDVLPFTLGQFFKEWGIAFNSTGIGQYRNGPAGTLSMTVNGTPNTLFNKYLVLNGDNVVITF